jgi:hypothetical protein
MLFVRVPGPYLQNGIKRYIYLEESLFYDRSSETNQLILNQFDESIQY